MTWVSVCSTRLYLCRDFKVLKMFGRVRSPCNWNGSDSILMKLKGSSLMIMGQCEKFTVAWPTVTSGALEMHVTVY
jgi:hypothetical protein